MASGARACLWADWGTATFARALADPCPVVLLVETRWSAPCADLRTRVLGDERVASVLAGRFALVAVDADERPDIAERYTADGWPTLLALTPHGWPLAPLPCRDPAACADALAHVADQFEARREALMRHVPPDSPVMARPGVSIDAAAILAGWLDDWEGEGGDRRAAAVPRALEVTIDRASRDGRNDLVERAVAVVDALAASSLRDAGSGLWFRAAPGEPDGWEPVQTLDDQAAWVAAEAAALIARPSDARAARLTRLVRAIDSALGGRHGYRAARFAIGPADARTRRDFADVCQHDDRQFVESQARMAAALMRGGGAGRMGTWTSRAVDRLDELVSTAYRRDGGVAHVLDEGGARLRGLVGDQVAVTAALLDAWDVSGRSAYLDAADELLQSTLRKFGDPASALLRDRVPTTAGAGDVGLLGRPLYPADANATAAGCLARIALVRDEPARAAAARDLLAACLAMADPADPAHPALLGALA